MVSLKGGGGGPITPTRPRREDKEIIDLAHRRTEELKRKIRDAEVDKESKRLMNQAKDRIKWYYPDHGPKHVQRVLDNVKVVSDVLDEVSTSIKHLGRELDDEDKFLLDTATKFHDVGRGLNEGENHASLSAKAVRENKNLPLDEKEREVVANLCQLHSKSDTRAIYGTEDMNQLNAKGIVDRRTAYLASILRVSDALDVTKERAKTNSQNEPSEAVMKRIKKTFPKSQSQRHLRSWAGHRGINNCGVKVKEKKILVSFALRSKSLESEGASVAFKIKDSLREFKSSTLGKNLHITFRCANKEALTRWYNSNSNILSDELEGMEVTLEK